MARETGTFEPKDVLNLEGGSLQRLYDQKHGELSEKFGPGVFNTHNRGDGSIEWTFDYADKFDAGVYTGGGRSVGALTPEQVEAVNHVNVIAKNSGSIKFVDGEYVPLEEDDEAAQQLCGHINIVEELLADNE